MSEPSAPHDRPIALVFDGPVAPIGGGAARRFLSTARLLAAQGFPVTMIHAWRGWSDTDQLALEPFASVLFHPDNVSPGDRFDRDIETLPQFVGNMGVVVSAPRRRLSTKDRCRAPSIRVIPDV
jgi:hypothetical protein